VFDPERDEDPGARRFYLRLLMVLAISAAGCLALWPSVSGFGAGPDHTTSCIAVVNGWSAGRSGPSEAEVNEALRSAPAQPTAAQRLDPDFMANYQAQMRILQASPVLQQADNFINWRDGPGACVNESRHRLIRSGIALVSLAVFCVGIAFTRRTRTNLRRHSAEVAEPDAGPVREYELSTRN